MTAMAKELHHPERDQIELSAVLEALSEPTRREIVLRLLEEEARAGQTEFLTSEQTPLHPLRIYGELMQLLGRDAIIVCDGGDFASYAGHAVDRYEPGTWLDPGPFGCLGAGAGYALAAKLAHPDKEVVVLYGDGAFGFSAITSWWTPRGSGPRGAWGGRWSATASRAPWRRNSAPENVSSLSTN